MVLVVPDTYLVSINAESGGQAVTNVVGIRKEFSGADLVTAAVLSAWKVAAGPLSLQSNTYTMKDIRAMFLGQADGEVYTRGDSSIGGVATSKSTNAACALISYGGSSRARTSKGRMYFGPLPENYINVDGRTLDATKITALDAAFNAFRSSLVGAGFEWVVVSRKLQSATTINAVKTQTVIATQRRRIR